MMSKEVFDSAALIPKVVAERLAQLITSDQKPKLIALTGGTLGIEVIREFGLLATPNLPVTFVFGDERYVGLADADRNEQQGLEAWPDLIDYLYRYPDCDLELADAKENFETAFKSRFGEVPTFDLTILGMGPDGHVASLFPGQHRPGDLVIAEPASPKPPAQRLSLSYKALNRSQEVWFIASGAAKADAVRCAFREDCDLPVAKISGQKSTRWFMDSELNRAL